MYVRTTCLAIAIVGCSEPRPVGSTTLNVQPHRPTFAGQFDFDLLDPVRGTACVSRESSFFGGTKVIYWMASTAFTDIPKDARPAVAAAAMDAVDKLTADSLVVTRVITEAKGEDEICAYVYGRGIRLTKAKTGAIAEPTAAHGQPNDDEKDGVEEKD